MTENRLLAVLLNIFLGNVTIPYFEEKVTIIVKNIYVKKSSLTAGYNKINNKIFLGSKKFDRYTARR